MTKSNFYPISYLFSVLFHPLLIPTYMLVTLLLANPYLFGVNNISEAGRYILLIFLYTFMLPMISTLLMKGLGFIESLQMPTREERIGPFIVTGIFYLWLFRNIYSDMSMPTPFITALLGTVIALFTAFLINLFYKISIHGVGMGGLLGVVIVVHQLFSYGSFSIFIEKSIEISTTSLLIVVLLLTGIVGTARLQLKAHRPVEWYSGVVLGLVCQYIALKIII